MGNIREMKDTCVAYGYFDGVHKGHLAVAKKVVEVAKEKGLTPVIVSYAKEGQVLSTEEEKEYLFKKEGVQEVVTYSENEAEEVVVKDVLAGTLGAYTPLGGFNLESATPKFAVGIPTVLPRALPCSTSPIMMYGCPQRS